LIIGLLVAWLFDGLFWHQSPGISFAIYVAVLLVAGLMLSFTERKPPARATMWLFLPIVVFALMTSVRLEPMTIFVSVCITLCLMMILVHTYRSGRWLEYSLSDYGVAAFKVLASMLVGAPGVARQTLQAGAENTPSTRWKSVRSLLPVFRGLLLALPLLIFFEALLASADPLFKAQIERFFESLSLEKLFEYTFRAGYVLILAYLLVGVYLYALTTSQEGKLIGVDKPVVRPVLGTIEACVTLACINLLFGAFVLVQFRYFFGSRANIHVDGLSYAEYARRGFGELVLVAFFSLLLFLGLSTLARRETTSQRRLFTTLGVLLGLLVGVILLSAFQRLLLYEHAFGFTRLRTYPHIFMVWLGITLAAFVLLEVVGRMRAFGLALLLAGMGFGLTLGLLNVDGLIAQRNIARARAGYDLDLDYLLTLSVDSTPAFVDWFYTPDLNPGLRDQIGAVLACQAAELGQQVSEQSWTGFHFSEWRAQRLLDGMQAEFGDYPVVNWYGEYALVEDNGEYRRCAGRWELD
jgi:hypothetical protein